MTVLLILNQLSTDEKAQAYWQTFIQQLQADNTHVIVFLLEETPIKTEDISFGIDGVFLLEQSNVALDLLADKIAQQCKLQQINTVLMADFEYSAELIARLSFSLKCPAYADLTVLNLAEKTFQCRLYGGNVTGDYHLASLNFCATLTPDCLLKTQQTTAQPLESTGITPFIETIKQPEQSFTQLLKVTKTPNLWKNHALFFIVGRGVSTANNVKKIEQLASFFNAEIAGTRAAVQNGWVERDRLIGVSGTLLEAGTAVVFGASGLPAFTIGINACENILAINQQENALIFKQSDWGLVQDLNSLLATAIEGLQEGDIEE